MYLFKMFNYCRFHFLSFQYVIVCSYLVNDLSISLLVEMILGALFQLFKCLMRVSVALI